MSIFDKYDLVDVDFEIPKPEVKRNGVNLIIGSSGSGKTRSLNDISSKSIKIDESKPIYKLFSDESSAETYLIAAGFRSVPAWKRTFNEVSNGEKHRVVVALSLELSSKTDDPVCIDEFTSFVDRNTAMSLCQSINKSKDKIGNIVLATCHKDVVDWLNFDYAFDMDLSSEIERGSLRRRIKLELQIKSCDIKEVWGIFKKHHYLSQSVNKSANCFVAILNGKVVAMTSVIAFPSGNWKDGWRGHRTVVLPEFQGLGIGTTLSDSVAEFIISKGCRFFSKTSHPAMGEHREKSDSWKPTSKNKVIRKDYKSGRKTKEDGHKLKHANRLCYSHEYVGGGK